MRQGFLDFIDKLVHGKPNRFFNQIKTMGNLPAEFSFYFLSLPTNINFGVFDSVTVVINISPGIALLEKPALLTNNQNLVKISKN